MKIEIVTERLKQAEAELYEKRNVRNRQEPVAVPRQFDLSTLPKRQEAAEIISNTSNSDQGGSARSLCDTVDTIKEEVQLNMNHWMARQAVQPLPMFDGKLDEWPMFHSAFERSTKLCGFSNEENLDRLQSALKGVAKQLVEGQFYLP